MRRLVCLIIAISFLLILLPADSYCYASGSNFELEWDHLTPHEIDRNLDTISLHILKKISQENNRSVYRGITITRPRGDINTDQQTLDSSTVGVGPVYMIRNEKGLTGKLTTAFDMSGGFIVYNKKFPAGGEFYDFMWRAGPKLIYKFSENSSVNIGYMLMHVSNGLKTHNPSYNAHGVSLGFVTNF